MVVANYNPNKNQIARLVYDSTYKALRVINSSGLKVHDVEEDGTTAYVGGLRADGTWQLMKIDESSNTNISYCSTGYATYALAWTNRATLTYTRIDGT
jgi:hypothetical protein